MSEKEIAEDMEPGTPKSNEEENKPEPEEPEEEKPPPVDPIEDKAKLKELIKASLSQISKTADNSGSFYKNLYLYSKKLCRKFNIQYQFISYKEK